MRIISLRRFIQTAGIGVLLWLTLSLGLSCAIAQSPVPNRPSRDTVALDGQSVIQVSAAGQYSAQERARLITLQLEEAAKSSEPVTVKVDQRNQFPTLLLDDRYLLTVTQSDALLGRTTEEQANLWAREIQESVQRSQRERSSGYIQQMALLASGVFLIVLFLHWLLGKIKQRGVRLLHQRFSASAPDASSHPLEGLLQLLLIVARVGVWLVAALYITNLFPVTRIWSYQITQSLISSFTSPLITLGKNSYSVTNLLLLTGVLVGVVGAAGVAANLIRSRVLSLAGFSRGGQDAIAILTKYALITVGTLIVLQIWGLDISSLTILASALGVGIGFGLQDIAKNFGSGLVLILERSIRVGDFVEIGSSKGTVERIGGRSTEIRTLDHVSVIVPNSRFLEEEVINWSHSNPVSRLHLPVGVTYDADPKIVRTVLLEAAKNHDEVLQSPPPQVFFIGFGDSSIDFDLLVWTAKPSRQFVLKSDLYFQIFELLQAHEIEIPFPQRDLHVRSGSLSLSPQAEALLTQRSQQSPNGESSP
ncbi:MAG TPA: mechanosensitive ion channel domain-containing protein [Leptolyngbya sp.]|nr:mechanosensitive ion channel domain-containing protein [Leptolyngbya sp.]